MVKLRLRRIGRKKLPIYKIVAADSRASRDGKFIESLGTYNPNFNPVQIDFKEERILYWLKSGAQPTDTVKNLLSRKGVLLKLNLIKKNADEQKISDEFNKWLSTQENRTQKENEKRIRRKEKKKTKAEKKPEETVTKITTEETISPASEEKLKEKASEEKTEEKASEEKTAEVKQEEKAVSKEGQ
ncbi:MAG: 30S ribosomal protein S16 [Ignavibacteria bacterium]